MWNHHIICEPVEHSLSYLCHYNLLDRDNCHCFIRCYATDRTFSHLSN